MRWPPGPTVAWTTGETSPRSLGAERPDLNLRPELAGDPEPSAAE
jgi:hypothetical protein